MLQHRSLWAAALVALASSLTASEFQVNVYTTGNQVGSAVAAQVDGSFVVVWASFDPDFQGSKIVGRRFAANGSPLGSELVISSSVAVLDREPAVSTGPSGEFVVAWTRTTDPDSYQGILGRRFDASGVPQGDEFAVSASTGVVNSYPAAAVAPGGDFVVVWERSPQEGIRGQRFDAGGAPLGGEFRIDADAPGYDSGPRVTTSAAGFVVAWQDQGEAGIRTVSRGLDPSGAPTGVEQIVADQGVLPVNLALARNHDGAIAAVWISRQLNGFGNVFARRLDSGGTPVSEEFLVNGFTRGEQWAPGIGLDEDGNPIVFWENRVVGDGFLAGILGRRFDASGIPGEGEFQVNVYTASTQGSPTVAVNADGRFLAAWQSSLQDGSGVGIFGTTGSVRAFNVAPASVLEGNSGTTSLGFTVSLTAAPTTTASVHYSTQPGSAGKSDFTTKSGVLSFAPGVASQIVTVPVKGDSLDEDDETFALQLTSPSGAGLSQPNAVGTILDNDLSPTVTVNDASVIEGGLGEARTATFTVALSAKSGRQVVVDYATHDGSATAPPDYVAKANTLVLPAGTLSKSLAVPASGDVAAEGDETFELTLSGASNAVISDDTGIGSILDDDDAPPAASVSDAVPVAEGGPSSFAVTLSPAPTQTVSVEFETVAGTALSGKDYTKKTGTLTFKSGETQKVVTVKTKADSLTEGPETFFLTLGDALGATVVDGEGSATITGP